MLVSRDISAISIPFSAGVMSAAYLPLGELSLYTAASLLCVAVPACLAMSCMHHRSRLPEIACFFLLGALVCLSARTSIPVSGREWRLPQRALCSLTAMIDGIDFGYADSSSLIKALLTGDRSSLSPELTGAFRDSGAAHILALSGLHMGIIYGLLAKMLSCLGRSRTAILIRSSAAIAACAFYMVMTGASPSVARAFLFITLNELARISKGRRRAPLNIFCAALMIQLCFDPLSARSVGFQLSYLAMLGIYTIFPMMESWCPDNWWKPVRKLWSASALSISCQLMTAPIAWIYFRSFPVYFLITNLIALPLTEAFITLAVITLILSAAGICPDIMKDLTGLCGQILIDCIETIASIS